MSEIAECVEMARGPLPEAPDLRIRGGRVTRRPTDKETKALIGRAQLGDVDARNILLVANQPLIQYVARRYHARADLKADVWSEGTFGIIRAIELFDLSVDVRFSTYAVHWIRAKIGRLLDGERKADVAPDKHGFVRLDNAIVDNDESMGANVEDVGVVMPDEALRQQEVRKALKDAVESFLSDYDRDHKTHKKDYMGLSQPAVVRGVLTYRILSDDPMPLFEVGAKFDLSREAIRIYQERIEAHLRTRLRASIPHLL